MKALHTIKVKPKMNSPRNKMLVKARTSKNGAMVSQGFMMIWKKLKAKN